MTHSPSVTAADNPPAMWRNATFAIVVSKTSMNVGMTTASATNHGLIARGTAVAEYSGTAIDDAFIISPAWRFQPETAAGLVLVRISPRSVLSAYSANRLMA